MRKFLLVCGLTVASFLLAAAAGVNLAGGTVNIWIVPDGGVSNGMLVNSSVTVTAGNGLAGGGAVALGAATRLDIPDSGVSNAMLVNPAITVTAAAGLGGGGTTQLGGTATLYIPDSGVANSMLVNPLVTVTAGAGLGGGGATQLGGTATLYIADGGLTPNMLAEVYGGTGACTAGTVVTGANAGAAPTCSAVDNARLSNSSLTVTAGQGLTGGGAIALGATGTIAVADGGVTASMLAEVYGGTGACTAGTVQTGSNAGAAPTCGTGAMNATYLSTDGGTINGSLKLLDAYATSTITADGGVALGCGTKLDFCPGDSNTNIVWEASGVLYSPVATFEFRTVVADDGVKIGGGAATVTRWDRATLTLPTEQLLGATCSDTPMTAAQSASNAECSVGLPATIEAGLLAQCFHSNGDGGVAQAIFRLCNVTAAPITPAGSQTASIRWTNP
jgi:hypothetical protein